MNNIKKILKWVKGPLILSIFAFLIIQQFYPQIINSRKGWASYLLSYMKIIPDYSVSYAPIVKKVSHSVVHIFTAKYSEEVNYNKHINIPTRVQKSLGSGVIVDKKGFILTNYHVINKTENLLISLADGRQAWANIVGTDKETDLAVLKINLPNLSSANWVNPQTGVLVGDIVLAIGNPFGLGQTVSAGIISATKRSLKLSTYESFLQTDAAINLGNSGGALINIDGKLVGICSALITSDGGNEGLGFAIPYDIANFILQSIIIHGKVIRGWLGIEAQILSPELSKAYNLPFNQGILVTNVYSNGPAEKAGIKKGDVMIKINKNNTNDSQSVMSYVASLRPGNKITATVLNDHNEKKKVTMTVSERPSIDQD